jgi:diguanylate cyclase (GGDEF)-like protein
MLSDAQRLLEQDTETHKERTWLYWVLTGPMAATMVIAYPPTRTLGVAAGWSIAGALTLMWAAYVARLYRTRGRLSDAEVAAGALTAIAVVAFLQWLCGGLHTPLGVLYGAQVFGASSVLKGRIRWVHLGLVLIAVLAPAVYDSASEAQSAAAGVWDLLLVLQAVLLYEHEVRLRAQRVALLEAERRASAQALTDELTGLGNRRALEADLDRAGLRLAVGQPVTVIYLDLDGFKAYNDMLGHAAGDALLQRLGIALNTCVDGHGHAYRVGGDEFCALLAGDYSGEHPVLAAICAALTEQGAGYAVTPSWGVVIAPDEAKDVRLALRLADQRMYVVKRTPRGADLAVA